MIGVRLTERSIEHLARLYDIIWKIEMNHLGFRYDYPAGDLIDVVGLFIEKCSLAEDIIVS